MSELTLFKQIKRLEDRIILLEKSNKDNMDRIEYLENELYEYLMNTKN